MMHHERISFFNWWLEYFYFFQFLFLIIWFQNCPEPFLKIIIIILSTVLFVKCFSFDLFLKIPNILGYLVCKMECV